MTADELRFAPLWVFGAVAGRVPGTEPAEDAAFWRGVHELAGRSGPGGDLLRATIAADRAALLEDLRRDGRPLASGLCAVAGLLEITAGGTDIRDTLLAVGRAVATARGPHGRSISREDAESLLLVAELLGAGDPVSA